MSVAKKLAAWLFRDYFFSRVRLARDVLHKEWLFYFRGYFVVILCVAIFRGYFPWLTVAILRFAWLFLYVCAWLI